MIAGSGASTTSKRGSAWSVETNPKYARAWLDSLSPVNNVESAFELFQSLRALNRMDLDAGQRFELMRLYQGPIREASDSLQTVFNRVSFPLSAKLRRMAEFLSQLHLETAMGYRLCLHDAVKGWLPWRRRQLLAPSAERALYYLTQVLLRAYQLYLPYPATLWRDAHALYRLVEDFGRQDERVDAEEGSGVAGISLSHRYRCLLMLGAANPYQMPFGECATVYRLLSRWIDQVRFGAPGAGDDGGGCFIVDPTVDAPPVPLARHAVNAEQKILNAGEFVRTLHVFLRRLEKGDTAAELRLGVDCLDSACHDLLQRLHRTFAQTSSRRHSRLKRHETVLICTGVGALHFFSGGQRSLPRSERLSITGLVLAAEPASSGAVAGDEAYVELDEPHTDVAQHAAAQDNFRLDRWQVRDVSPQGLMLAQDGESGTRLRVGDVLGAQRTNVNEQWSVGIVRWLRARGEKGIEIGVELIAPDAAAASIVSATDAEAPVPIPALALPVVEAAHRPASLLVRTGAVQAGKDFFLSDAARGTRRVRILDVIERTGSVEQVIFGNVIE